MLPLYLLAAHLVGDFVLQTRWQAVGKFTDSSLRMRHVWTYSIPFWPIAVAYDEGTRWHGLAFIVGLVLLHFLTDSRRFASTLGDVVAWRMMSGNNVAGTLKKPGEAEQPIYMRLPPNPWTPIPILIDQSLHVVQLAVLGGLFLT